MSRMTNPTTLEEALSLIATLRSTRDEHVATIGKHVATIDERDTIISEHVDAIRARDEEILELRHACWPSGSGRVPSDLRS